MARPDSPRLNLHGTAKHTIDMMLEMLTLSLLVDLREINRLVKQVSAYFTRKLNLGTGRRHIKKRIARLFAWRVSRAFSISICTGWRITGLASRAYEGSWGIHCEVEDSANSVVFDRFFVENRVNSLRRPFWIERVEQ